MPLKFEFQLALSFFIRNFKFGKFPFFMVALAAALVIVIISVAEGLDNELINKLIGVTSHIELTTADGLGFSNYDKFIREIMTKYGDKFAGVAPRFISDTILSKDEFTAGIRLIGIDPIYERDVSLFLPKKLDTAENAVSKNREKDFFAVGKVLFERFKMKKGEKVKITTLRHENFFEVTSTFEIGIYDYDISFAFCDIKKLQTLLGYEGVATSILIRLNDIKDTDGFADILKRDIANKEIIVKTWKDINKSLFATIKIERAVLYLIILLTVLIANISIAFIVIMNIYRRSKSVAIMSALGTPENKIARVFFIEGFIMGIAGLITGGILGIALVNFIDRSGIGVPSEISIYYSITKIPACLNYNNILTIGVIEFIVLIAACYFSTRKIFTSSIIDNLKNL